MVTALAAAGVTPGVVALLLLAAFVAGFIDAIAGGGGLITVPALLAAGLPTPLVLGTNKGQAVFGSGASMLSFWRAGRVDGQRAPLAFVAGALGSLGGASLVLLVSPEVLRPLVMVLLVAVAVFLTLRPPLPVGVAAGRSPLALRDPARARLVGAGLALVIGGYDGFFGPGTGTFLIISFVLLLGQNLTSASADAKVVNFASNLAAMTLFAVKGTVLWPVALPMAAAQFVGGWTGAKVAVRGGDRLVRWVVLGVVVALVGKLAFDAWRG